MCHDGLENKSINEFSILLPQICVVESCSFQFICTLYKKSINRIFIFNACNRGGYGRRIVPTASRSVSYISTFSVQILDPRCK